MRSILTVAPMACAKGCLPCVLPSRATALCFPRRSWRKLTRWAGKAPLHTRCGNEPPWCCSCLNNRWCPTARLQNRASSIRVPCHGGATAGPRGTWTWQTSRDGAARPIFPPRDHALVKAVACERGAAPKQPLRRQALADVTARVRPGLGTPLSRSTVWRILATAARKPWRYK